MSDERRYAVRGQTIVCDGDLVMGLNTAADLLNDHYKSIAELEAALAKESGRLDWACSEAGLRLASPKNPVPAWVLTIETNKAGEASLREAIDAAQAGKEKKQ